MNAALIHPKISNIPQIFQPGECTCYTGCWQQFCALNEVYSSQQGECQSSQRSHLIKVQQVNITFNIHFILSEQLNKWMCESVYVVLGPSGPPTGLHVGQFCPQKVCCHAKPCLHRGCSLVPPSSPSSCSYSCLACQPHNTRVSPGSLAVVHYIILSVTL